MGAARCPQQRIVLHVARTDLYDVGILGDQLDTLRIESLCHHRQTRRLTGHRQKLQASLAQSLKGIRRCARLEGASTQDRCTRRLQVFRNAEYLLLALHRAGAGHEDHIRSTDHRVVLEPDERRFIAPFTADLLVGLGDRDDVEYSWQRDEARGVHVAIVADQANGDALLARHGTPLVPHLFDGANDPIDIVGPGAMLHDY